jgi:pimeloyl-ACP methyl ester carboxylesterase
MTTRLVLVHGTRVTGAAWRLPAYQEVLAGFDVVTPDLPGHGARLGERFTTEAATAVIGEAVEGGDPAEPVVLAGHSLGGYMAMAYAAKHPTRLAGLVLVGASAVPRGPGAAAYRAFASLIPRLGAQRLARLSNRAMARLTDEQTARAVLDEGESYAATADAWAAVMADGDPSLLREVTCPVLLVSGQWDQLRVHARQFAAQCRDARVVVVPRATHLLPLSHPQVVASLLRDFALEVGDGADSGHRAST